MPMFHSDNIRFYVLALVLIICSIAGCTKSISPSEIKPGNTVIEVYNKISILGYTSPYKFKIFDNGTEVGSVGVNSFFTWQREFGSMTLKVESEASLKIGRIPPLSIELSGNKYYQFVIIHDQKSSSLKLLEVPAH